MTLMESALICLYEKSEIGTWRDFNVGCHRVGGEVYLAVISEKMDLAFELLRMNGRLEEGNTNFDIRFFTGNNMYVYVQYTP